LLTIANQIKYINLHYPENLEYYFELYDDKSLITNELMNVLHTKSISQTTEDLITIKNKFSIYNVSPYYLNNVKYKGILTLFYIFIGYLILHIGFLKSIFFKKYPIKSK